MNKTTFYSAFLACLLNMLPCFPWNPLLLSSAYADTTSKNIDVNANVVSNCIFTGSGSGSSIEFGTYDPVIINQLLSLTTSMNFGIRCNKGTAVSIELDYGQNPSGSTRRMQANGEYLEYELYKDPAYSLVWGQGVSNALSYVVNNFLPLNATVYAKIYPGQDVPAGTYTDTVIVTAIF